jgi:hypothetical protein
MPLGQPQAQQAQAMPQAQPRVQPRAQPQAPQAQAPRGRNARAGQPEQPRSSVGANMTAGEIGSGKHAIGTGPGAMSARAPARPGPPPPARASGLPPPPTAWAPPRSATDTPATRSTPTGPPPAATAADTLEDMPQAPGRSQTAMAAPGAGDVVTDLAPDVAAPEDDHGVVDVPADMDMDMAAAITAPVRAEDAPEAAVAERAGRPDWERRDSFDDFAQEGPPVSELSDDRTVPTVRSGSGDPTVLMDKPGPDLTQVVRQREGDLPRRQGVLGDLRYLFTALIGVVKARKQIRDLREKLEVEREARKGLVRLMARELLDSRAVDVEAVREARALLDEVETERARHAAEVVATTAEIAALEEDGEAESLAADAEIGRIAGAIAELDQEIEELEHVVAGLHRQLNATRVETRRLERRIARLDKRLDSDSAEEVAKIQAELAAVRAMHETALAAQPRMEAELQALLPRIEALQARQTEREVELAAAQERVQAIEEQSAQRVTAAQARKEAAARALAATADEVLELVGGLGDRLCLERPESPAPGMARMAMIDACDSATADFERQILERTERLRRIDKAAIARGALLAVALSAAMAALIWLGLRL